MPPFPYPPPEVHTISPLRNERDIGGSAQLRVLLVGMLGRFKSGGAGPVLGELHEITGVGRCPFLANLFLFHSAHFRWI